MSDGIYIGMAGATARESQLDSIADNLANVQTPGFKAARPAFESFMPQQDPRGISMPAAVVVGSDMTPGTLVTTGNPLDVTPEGDAMLGVKVGDGVAYTRNGRISLTADGGLSVVGHPLLNRAGQPLTVPLNSHVEISDRGVVRANGQPVDEIAMFHLSGTPERIAPSLFGPAANTAAVPVTGKLQVGTLEQGNFSPIQAAVQLVSAQRNFETSLKAIETYKQMGDRANQLGQVS